jgi:signal transduction histidine kinase
MAGSPSSAATRWPLLPSALDVLAGTEHAAVRTQDTANVADSRHRRRPRIFIKYLLLFAAVISAAVAVSGVLSIWFAYREQTDSLRGIQAIQARAAADRIEQFITAIQNQLGWVTNLPWSDPTLAEQRRLDARRLLSQVPAITEIALIDPDGREQLHISRLAMDIVGSNIDVSAESKFLEAIANGVYFGPVYYRRESAPYMTVSAAGARRDNGVAIAEVNLILLWDLVSAIDVGETGLAYVVDAGGRLIAHPDNSLVLRNTNLAGLAQVAAALAGDPEADVAALSVDGAPVISAAAAIPGLHWIVFAELPVREALTPVYQSVVRTTALLVLGVVLAVILAIFFTRRMVGPIGVIEAGAARIGGGDLGHRISVSTGDELEALARQFNEMAGHLEAERAGLERRVAERTAELEEKSRQLALASTHKSQFLANMSHELRTPLNAILGFAELLLDGVYGPLPPKTRQVVERVQANGAHLLGLINDVLDLSKIEAGQLALTFDKYDLAATVRSVASATEPLAQAKSLALSTTIDGPLAPATGDERRIRQVLLNLVGNAIKFTDSGSVKVVARQRDGEIEIDVSDTGPGIPETDRERIFEEFQQLDSSPTRSKGGTGLGLAISRRIAELHGGRIMLMSTLGRGATFRIVLPIDPLRSAPHPAELGGGATSP